MTPANYQIRDSCTGEILETLDAGLFDEAVFIFSMYQEDGIDAEIWTDAEGVWARIPEEELII